MVHLTSFIRKIFAFAALLFIPVPATAQTSYYQHVFFDNSLTDSAYFYSTGEQAGKSTITLRGGRIPISDSVFYNPPNSLKLNWSSAPGGFWESVIQFKEWRNRNPQFTGNTLSFWIYTASDMDKKALPAIQLEFGGQHRTVEWSLFHFVDSLKMGEWGEVRIPLSRFSLNRTDLTKVIFRQHADDGKPHTMYVDHVKIFDSKESYKKPSIPEQVEAKGYDSHTDITWREPEQTHYVLISRSEDGEHYEPVGIQRAGLGRYSDFTGRQDKQWWYRIKAVNMLGDESEWSDTVSSTIEMMTDEKLLTMVQEASFQSSVRGFLFVVKTGSTHRPCRQVRDVAGRPETGGRETGGRETGHLR